MKSGSSKPKNQYSRFPAGILGELREHVNGEVRFVFQHAEELPYGGAEELVEAGAVDGADAVIGLHLAASLEAGKVGMSSVAMLAARQV